jgi:class 3 adenylate cyclase
LFLSPKTIEVHLSRVYRKLGVRSRTELSRHMMLHRATGSSPAPVRMLASLLSIGFVSLTSDAAGPAAKTVSLTARTREVTAAVASNGGRLLKASGDGVLAVFDVPSAALHCAFDICAAALECDVKACAAVHAGEIDSFPDGEIRGIAVGIADRALAHARAGEVLATQTVRDAVYGSALEFRPRGNVDLTDAGSWKLFTAIPE